MVKEEREKDGHICYLRYYRDWLEFVSCAEKVLAGCEGKWFNGGGCRSLDIGEAGWFGTSSLKETIDLARNGWPEGRQHLAIPGLSAENLFTFSQRIIRQIDTAGDEPDIGLFLQGEPEHMVTLVETIERNRGKVIRILLNRACSSDIGIDRVVRKGVSVFAAIQNLMLLGFAVEITIVEACSRSSYEYVQFIPILHAGEPINLDTLAFMLIHPSVLRRLCFSAEECESPEIRRRFEFFSSRGYGIPCEPSFHEEYDLYLPWRKGLVGSDAEVVPFFKQILNEVGVQLP